MHFTLRALWIGLGLGSGAVSLVIPLLAIDGKISERELWVLLIAFVMPIIGAFCRTAPDPAK